MQAAGLNLLPVPLKQGLGGTIPFSHFLHVPKAFLAALRGVGQGEITVMVNWRVLAWHRGHFSAAQLQISERLNA